jgi:5'-phosphate synthase pdxT subunit
MRIGVVGLQGAVSEHLGAVERAFRMLQVKGEVLWVRRPDQLERIDGVIIPGGESTTIGRLMASGGLFEPIRKLGLEGTPILGTCAGLILLAKRGDEQVRKTGQPLLGLMDISVVRNAFGRQRESFEASLRVPKFGEEPFECVFIRAPAIERAWGDVEVLAEYGGKIVAAQQGRLVAMAFHPELTPDTRAHEYFLRLCQE